MKKLVGVYRCRFCQKLTQISTVEEFLEDEQFHEPFDSRVFNLKPNSVSTWAIKKNGYSEFKMVIIHHCNHCLSSVALFDLTKFSLIESE